MNASAAAARVSIRRGFASAIVGFGLILTAAWILLLVYGLVIAIERAV